MGWAMPAAAWKQPGPGRRLLLDSPEETILDQAMAARITPIGPSPTLAADVRDGGGATPGTSAASLHSVATHAKYAAGGADHHR
jgi:hypothetical protein